MNIDKSKYYLETSSLRKLTNELQTKFILSNCFTSSLSLIEIISGIDCDSFMIRRNILSKLFDSKLSINWQFPEEIIASAFPAIFGIENRLTSLKNLCHLIISCDSYEMFNNLLTNLNWRFNLDYFHNYDEFFSNKFVNETKTGNIHSKKLFDDLNLSDYKSSENDEIITREELLDQLQSKHKSINLSATIRSISRGYAHEVTSRTGSLNFNDVETKIYNSYNGKLYFYIEAFSYYTIEKMKKYEEPAKNDYFDLLHFLYLQNFKNVKIVTDDKLIRKISVELFQDKYITVNDIISESQQNKTF